MADVFWYKLRPHITRGGIGEGRGRVRGEEWALREAPPKYGRLLFLFRGSQMQKEGINILDKG